MLLQNGEREYHNNKQLKKGNSCHAGNNNAWGAPTVIKIVFLAHDHQVLLYWQERLERKEKKN
jgi:hypothetical protein